jgi:hypothetical protein
MVILDNDILEASKMYLNHYKILQNEIKFPRLESSPNKPGIFN